MTQLSFSGNPFFLVTGAAGFIGTNLCEAILSMGFRVRALDNYITGLPENIDRLAGNPDFEFIEGDITDYDTCLVACEGISYVLHQAALGSIPRSIREPLLYESNNIRGTANMMEAAARRNVARFVYASSSSVYGDHPELCKREGQEGAPLAPYALSKAVNERYGSLYTSLYGLECVGLRYFNVFGPRQNPLSQYAAVIPRFITALRAGEQAQIFGDGAQSRDFTYIDNVVQANLLACLAPRDAAGSAYNIACGEKTTLIELYSGICSNLGINREPLFAPPRAGDIKHSYADISTSRRMLSYSPTVKLAEGLERTVRWYCEAEGR